MNLRVSEWIALGFFAYLCAAALLGPVEVRHRRGAGLILAGIGATFLLRARMTVSDSVIRDWLPIGDLLLAYWLPALIAPAPNVGWERRFLMLDRRWLGADLARYSQRLPSMLAVLFELSYLFCYPMVPLGFAILFFEGFRGDVQRFWTAVLVAVLPCYGLVVWLPIRPPRMLEGMTTTPAGSVVRWLNLQVLRHASIQLNTFPSAHVAGSIATALAVTARLPVIGAALCVIAAGITIGSVLRRYHYAVDAVAGLALGLGGFVVSRHI